MHTCHADIHVVHNPSFDCIYNNTQFFVFLGWKFASKIHHQSFILKEWLHTCIKYAIKLHKRNKIFLFHQHLEQWSRYTLNVASAHNYTEPIQPLCFDGHLHCMFSSTHSIHFLLNWWMVLVRLCWMLKISKMLIRIVSHLVVVMLSFVGSMLSSVIFLLSLQLFFFVNSSFSFFLETLSCFLISFSSCFFLLLLFSLFQNG